VIARVIINDYSTQNEVPHSCLTIPLRGITPENNRTNLISSETRVPVLHAADSSLYEVFISLHAVVTESQNTGARHTNLKTEVNVMMKWSFGFRITQGHPDHCSITGKPMGYSLLQSRPK